MTQSSIRSQVLSLGASKFIDYGMQFLVPVVLARVFEPEEYGRYMLVWLVVNTALIVTTLSMPQSLLYFLPQSRSEAEKVQYTLHAMLFLIVTGLVAALAVNPWVPLLPSRIVAISEHAWIVPALVFLWTLSQLTDILPTAEGRVGWQSSAIISLSLIRSILLAGIAWYSRDIELVFLGLVGFALLKVIVLLVYLFLYHAPASWDVDQRLLQAQIGYAIPFGIGAGLFMLRNQADQWIAASLFSMSEFSLFVIGGAYLGAFLTLIRESVHSIVVPKLSRSHAEGDREAVITLSRASNIQTAHILFPVLAWFFVFAGDIIEVIFSSVYRDAALVMRIYIFSYLTQTFEVNNLFRVVGGGRFSIYLSLGLLAPAVAVSFWGGGTFGLWGVALGAVVFAYVGETLKLKYVATQLAAPIARIVDWPTWGILFLASLVSGLLAYYTMDYCADDVRWPFLRSVFGAGIIAMTYSMLVALARGSLLSWYFNMVRFRRAA